MGRRSLRDEQFSLYEHSCDTAGFSLTLYLQIYSISIEWMSIEIIVKGCKIIIFV